MIGSFDEAITSAFVLQKNILLYSTLVCLTASASASASAAAAAAPAATTAAALRRSRDVHTTGLAAPDVLIEG